MRYEIRLYISLARWLSRRPSIPDDAMPIGYAKATTPVILLWIFASALEIPLIHVLIPWDTIRIIGLAIGVWGLIWMLGLLASLHVYPHLFDSSRLRVRNGASVDVAVPWEAIDSLSARRGDLPSSARTFQPEETERGTHLRIGVSGQINVHASLVAPLTVETPHGPKEIVELSFLADDPRAFTKRAREYVDAAAVSRVRRSGR
ncbi:MAG: hypothetical protein L0K86_03405 [Actinomycetia bacterium]|nr:hypothetical protein [Actinomycetes bacterium]